MSQARTRFTVFTKPWKLPLPELGRLVRGLGFEGVELPVRPGFQVEPENVGRDLPEAARILADCGLKIGSIAGLTDERTIAACAAAGVGLIRICVPIPRERDYVAAIADYQRGWEGLVPVLERYGVALGIQNHAGRYLANAAQLRAALGPFDPRYVGAVWDAAHSALQGEDADLALDMVWPHLRLVNLKNVYWKWASGVETGGARWTHYWTTGRDGLADWGWVARELIRRGYAGDVCLTAEYSDHAAVDRLIAEDIQWARALWA